jgi:hypothetical protein
MWCGGLTIKHETTVSGARRRPAGKAVLANQNGSALGSYYDGVGGGGLHQFPESLEELLQDNRSLATVRHLRRLYPDPITGGDWELIRDAKGRIKGVRSSSRLTPFQQDGFRPENKSFSGRQSYAAWEFIATPTAKKQKGKAPAPATPQRPAVAFPPMS